MNREDLKVIWFCRECGISFVFRSDVDDHEENEGHSRIAKYDLASYMDMGVDIGVESV
ncbi:MAG TPA: hypothetical protein VFI73_05215 [Candidatus Nitrosopolaris sp.]|nr:hypothetical protein [Candidatus Nitrosopolaris sp.]